jgi:hypothetical protein
MRHALLWRHYKLIAREALVTFLGSRVAQLEKHLFTSAIFLSPRQSAVGAALDDASAFAGRNVGDEHSALRPLAAERAL